VGFIIMKQSQPSADPAPHVGLYVTCLVDILRPSVAFATIKVLEQAGCRVTVPADQTCCGQPALNSGDLKTARALADAVLDAFEPFDYVVAPSGSCAATLKVHLPTLYSNDADKARAERFADRVFELTAFLAHIADGTAVQSAFAGRVAYHDGCSGKRELGVSSAPRQLLHAMDGVDLVEINDTDACCGFGGTFSVSYPEISNVMVSKKCDAITDVAPDILTGSELGCLLNIAGKLKRSGSPISCRHIAELLADDMTTPAIGAGKEDR